MNKSIELASGQEHSAFLVWGKGIPSVASSVASRGIEQEVVHFRELELSANASKRLQAVTPTMKDNHQLRVVGPGGFLGWNKQMFKFLSLGLQAEGGGMHYCLAHIALHNNAFWIRFQEGKKKATWRVRRGYQVAKGGYSFI